MLACDTSDLWVSANLFVCCFSWSIVFKCAAFSPAAEALSSYFDTEFALFIVLYCGANIYGTDSLSMMMARDSLATILFMRSSARAGAAFLVMKLER